MSIENNKSYLKEVGPAFQLRQIAERLSQSLHAALKPYGETPNSYRVLLALSRGGKLTTQELRGETMLIASTLSRTLDKLKSKGYINVEVCDKDIRAQKIEVTKEGMLQLENIFHAAESQYQWAIRDISKEEIDELSKILFKMLNNIKNSPIK